jgi:inhibitor of cysteine peptidase
MHRAAAVPLLILTLLAMACRPAQAQPALQAQPATDCPDLDDSTAPITVRVGERFVVGLQSNPTTGYSWQVDDASLGGIVQQVGSEYVPAQPAHPGGPPVAGAGGKECLTFEGIAVGTTTLALSYRRPFEPPTTPPVKTKQLTVTVAPGSAPAQVP